MTIQIRHNVFIRTNTIQSGRPSVWCIHGFADSGLAYKAVFDSPLCEVVNIYVVDLPGFGVSPLQPDFPSIKEQATLLSKIITEETTAQDRVNIVAHSLGGLIGTWICQSLKEKIHYYFNIEGNLTESDSYFSSKPLQFNSAKEFVTTFKNEIFEKAKTEERYQNYYSSLCFATPEGMWNWSLTSQEHIKANRCGTEFNALTCNTLYIWGDRDTPRETQKFLKENEIPNKLYQGMGHWHMIENASQLYTDILEKIKTV